MAQHVQEDPAISGQSLELDEVIWSRVQRLPPDSIRLLELVAVAGRPIAVSEAYLAAHAVDKGPSLLAQLRTSNFIRTGEAESGGTMVETYHDRIRESVLSHLDEQTRIDHSLSLAKTIEQASGISVSDLQSHIRTTRDYAEPGAPYALDKHQWQRVFDLAFFFDAAGDHDRALPYAIVAAEQARAQNALEVAEQQYVIAAHGAKAFGDAMQFRVAEGLGDVLTLRGKYDQAEQQYVMAQALTKDKVSLARIDGNLGFLAFKKGDMGRAADCVEKALTELGNPPPGNVLTQTAAILKEAGVQLLHTYMPKWFVGRRRAETERQRMDLFRARLYDELCYPYWFKKGTASCLWAHLRHMNLAERYPASRELGRAYAMHAVMITAIPLAKRGAAYAEKSFQIHRDQGDLQGQGKARSFQTFSLLALGRFQEGVESGREAVRLLEQAGDVWEANMARLIMAQPLHFLGDLKNSYREAKLAYEIGQQTGDYAAMAIALAFWIPNAPSTLPAGAIEVESQREREDPLCSSVLIQSRGLDLLLCQDNPAQAAEVFQESLDLARGKGLRNPCIFTGVSWKATALRIVAERASDPATRQRTLREAKKAVSAALKITKKYLHCRAHALRERALIAVLAGKEDQARRYFDASLQIAEQQGARYEHAKTLLAEAEAGKKFGWQFSDRQLIEARTAIAEMEDIFAPDS